MSASSSRLLRLSLAYGACFVVIAAHQLWVMGPRSEEWSVRSYRNRWTFKDVPSVRGSLKDRHGESLAHDEPTFSLDCVYERFRLRHPVGAAVHGATLATKLSGAEVRYSYFGGALGPAAAARLLLSVPVDALLYADLPKEEKRELQSSAITLLCALAERSRSRVRKDLLAAAKSTPHAAIGDCLPELSSEQLLVQFAGVHSRLVALDRALQEAEAKRKGKLATIFDEDEDDPFAFDADAAPQVEAAAPVSRK
ncbi:MAG: hypothetical protein RLZZ562_2292 [Planctomycetota bacterium]